mmetsp:Transcript_41782/g.67781  ORF Transcript_41782/g.67781 Transcript_41782/m.67781 type:complete len:89 (-) Transcript_41782:259-525(-)
MAIAPSALVIAADVLRRTPPSSVASTSLTLSSPLSKQDRLLPFFFSPLFVPPSIIFVFFLPFNHTTHNITQQQQQQPPSSPVLLPTPF